MSMSIRYPCSESKLPHGSFEIESLRRPKLAPITMAECVMFCAWPCVGLILGREKHNLLASRLWNGCETADQGLARSFASLDEADIYIFKDPSFETIKAMKMNEYECPRNLFGEADVGAVHANSNRVSQRAVTRVVESFNHPAVRN